jgi:hypothetical protein
MHQVDGLLVPIIGGVLQILEIFFTFEYPLSNIGLYAIAQITVALS